MPGINNPEDAMTFPPEVEEALKCADSCGFKCHALTILAQALRAEREARVEAEKKLAADFDTRWREIIDTGKNIREWKEYATEQRLKAESAEREVGELRAEVSRAWKGCADADRMRGEVQHERDGYCDECQTLRAEGANRERQFGIVASERNDLVGKLSAREQALENAEHRAKLMIDDYASLKARVEKMERAGDVAASICRNHRCYSEADAWAEAKEKRG